MRRTLAIPATGKVLLENCTVIDCTEPDRQLPGAAILLSGPVIERVGPWSEVLAGFDLRGVERRDLSGMFVIPGLWDSHIHLGAVVVPYEDEYAHETPAHHMIRCIRKAQDNLRCGITTLRSLGEEFDADLVLRDAIAAGEIEGPRIYAAADVMWSQRATGPDEFRRAVRGAVRSGVDTVKLLSSGGIPWRSDSIGRGLHSFEEISAAVGEAHGWGKPVAVHAMGDETVVAAAKAGADTIEHGFVVTEEGISAMAEAGTIFCPNLAVTDAWEPEQLAAQGYPGWFCRNAEEARERHHAMFREAVRQGVPIVAGVDDLPEGPAPVGIEMHHGTLGLVEELRLMSVHGLGNGGALLAATKNAAATVRASTRLGTLEAGKVADLVVLGADPLADLTALTTVREVWKEGKPIRLTPSLEPGWQGGGIR
ncbi:metal-dependent hydrolase family protein [Amycolatopsis jejuensis]|uniref:metal-dependent hydrolase family protein n=1 Tax=Amycolatopsis jejuensis TaxID=330084 RepID=UPI00052757CF|nr:amidohydrolase family protein [Amycolatopsis jejuensis]